MSHLSQPSHNPEIRNNPETSISPEVQKKIDLIAKKVEQIFQENPEVQEAFKSLLHETIKPILEDPVKFHLLVDRLYEKYENDISVLSGRERTERIKNFSPFITEVMEEYAALSHMPDLSEELKRGKAYLESHTNDIQEQSANSLKH